LRPNSRAIAAAHVKAGEAFNPALFKQFVPAADGVVIHQQRIGHLLSAPPAVQQHQGVGAPRHPSRRRTLARQRNELATIVCAEESAANHAPTGIPLAEKRKRLLPNLQQEISPESSMSQGISSRCVELVGPTVDNRLLIEQIHGGDDALLDFLFGGGADVAQNRAASLEKKPSMRLSREPWVGVKLKAKRC